MHGDFAHALQVLIDLGVEAVVDLGLGDAFVGGAHGHVGAAHLGFEAGGGGHAGGVVAGAVDAHTGRQALHGGLQALGRLVQRLLAEERGNVGVDDLCHDFLLALVQ